MMTINLIGLINNRVQGEFINKKEEEKKMARKLLGLILCIALAGVLLVGCTGNNGDEGNTNNGGGSNTEATVNDSNDTDSTASNYGDTGGIKLPIVDKPTKITWIVSSETPDLQDTLFVKEIEKRTGITLELMGYSAATVNDKAKVILASGKLPDIFGFGGVTISQGNKLGSQGAFVAINEYLDELPNFKKLYYDTPENYEIMKSVTDDNGNLYGWPVYGVSRDVNHGFLYRKDIFDKHGIKEWTNTEEFYQALKELKKHYPDSVPYASKTKETIFSDWAYGWGVGGTGSASYPAVFEEDTKTWKLATTSDEYKNMLDFMKKLYNEGLLDPEFITDTAASWTTKMTTNNKAFVTFDWIGRLDQFYNQVKEQNPDYDLRYGNPVGPTGNIRTLSKISPGRVYVANNPNKEVALKLLDYLISPSGSELATIGAEGVNFEWDEDGKPYYPELQDLPSVDIKTLSDRYGLWLGDTYVKADPRSVYFNYTEKEQEAQDKINEGNHFEPLDPILKLSDEETSLVAELKATLDKEGKDFSTKYVMNESYGEKEWQDWLKNAKKLGEEDYINVYNNAQKRLDAAN